MKKIIKKTDIIIAAIVIVLLAILVLIVFLQAGGDYAIIKVDGVDTKTLDLNKNEEYTYTSKEEGFQNVIIVKDGKVHMESANCRDKLCVGMKPIDKNGGSIICLPHRLIVTIVDAPTDEIDIYIQN